MCDKSHIIEQYSYSKLKMAVPGSMQDSDYTFSIL
jgi:hypothetical protein